MPGTAHGAAMEPTRRDSERKRESFAVNVGRLRPQERSIQIGNQDVIGGFGWVAGKGLVRFWVEFEGLRWGMLS